MSTLHLFIPVRNRLRLLIETLSSVVSEKQISKELEINITVLSNSDDESKQIVSAKFKGRVNFIESEDQGLYDALGKYLPLVHDGYISWLGAGDIWVPGAANHINQVIKNGVNWFMGIPQILDIHGNTKLQYPKRNYNSRLIREGWHDGYLPFIQQESTFWNSKLNYLIDWDKFRNLQLAGDYFLWKSFSETEKLYSSSEFIAGFRQHDNSLSSNYYLYKKEIRSFTKKTLLGFLMSKIVRIQLIFQKAMRFFK